MAYDALGSFELPYHFVEFKDFDLPQMDQWAFFMFMIGQTARKKFVSFLAGIF